ncbi:hypothetical protein M9H77_31995 [Catharanthus roseus]|uniref:Uncharacterized protein n=1 Tax=Catharanthus roseus TaxID=4058 RepID=A0ACC0A1Q3_CATRO|nr:hypothetical protein M9H77_31995 [Catharanthus roseus]
MVGSVRGLHCTWLVPRTRASSDGVDDSDSRKWIHLKRGVDREGCGPIGLRGHRIMLCCVVRLPSEDIACFLHWGVEAVLMCLDSLRLPSCARTLFCLVPRGTYIPYSATVNLVAGLGPYMPDRVLRQFGFRQCIPAHPIQPREARRPLNNRMYVLRNTFVEALWLQAPSHLLTKTWTSIPAIPASSFTDDYLDW